MVIGIVTGHEYDGRADMEVCWHLPVRGTAKDMCRLPARCHAKTRLDPYPWERRTATGYVANTSVPWPPDQKFVPGVGAPYFKPRPGLEQDLSKYPEYDEEFKETLPL